MGVNPICQFVLSRTDVTSAIDGEINLILGYRMNVAFSVWGVPPLFWFSDHLNPQPHLYFNSHLRFWKNTVAYGIKRTCIDLANKIPLCDGVRCVAPCPTLKLYGFYLWKESLRKNRGERVLTQLPRSQFIVLFWRLEHNLRGGWIPDTH